MKNSSDFSIRQKVTILVAMLVELVAPNIQPFERLPFVSKTRGNVFQRLKGKITAEEHDSYIKSANTIRATNEWCEKYRNRLEQTVRVYNHGQKAYKSAQQLLLRIDDKVHNEFSYYARAKTSIVKGILDDKFDSNFDMAVNDAFGAARHILNDCLDLVVAYATHETMRLSQICKYTTISDVYSDFPQVKRTIDNIAHAISHSRSERGIERVDSYIGIVESDSYQKLLDYCHDVQVIEDNLKSKKKSEKNAATKFAIVLSASLCGAVWAIYKFYTVVYPPTP